MRLKRELYDVCNGINRGLKDLYDKIFDRNALMPNDFFFHKEESTPKANTKIMFWCSIVVYLISIGTFVGIFIVQSNDYISETAVETSDISNDQWSCAMASIQTKTVGLTAEDPVVSYNLVQINELKPQCYNNIYTADPCKEENLLYSASSTYTPYLGFYIKGISQPYNNIVYLSGGGVSYEKAIGKINLQNGQYEFKGVSISLVNQQQIIQDTLGMGYYLYPIGNGCYGIINYDSIKMSLSNDFPCNFPISNDNNLNMYIISEQNDLLLVTIENSIATTKFVLKINSNISISYFDVYCDDNGKYSIYYMNPLANIFAYIDGYNYQLYYNTKTFIFTYFIQVDNTNNRLFVSNPSGSGILMYDLTKIGQSNFTLLEATSSSYSAIFGQAGGFSVLNANSIIYGVYKSKIDGKLLNYIVKPNEVINYYKGFSGTKAGWFICNDQVMLSLPQQDNVLSSYCSLNGLAYSVTLENSYIFTINGVKAYSIKEVSSNCTTQLYDTICDNVGNLPPYICTRKIYNSFFYTTSTALANSQFVMTILFILLGIFFDYYGDILFPEFPKIQTNFPDENDLKNTVELSTLR